MLEELFGELAPFEADFFMGEDQDAPWNAIEGLCGRIKRWLFAVNAHKHLIADSARVDGHVACETLFTAADVMIEPTAVLVGGPVVIGPDTVIRAGAYIRGPAFIGGNVLVGHATEIKNSILLAHSAAPHFAFVGDSILGHNVNLGAGTRLANLRLDRKPVRVRWNGSRIDTGMAKLGALIGDGAQTGCNSVLNPGTILMPGAAVSPCTAVHGTLERV